MGRGVLDIMDFELETFWVGEVLYLRDRNGGSIGDLYESPMTHAEMQEGV